MIGLKSFVFPSCCFARPVARHGSVLALPARQVVLVDGGAVPLSVRVVILYRVAIAVKHKEQLRILMFMDVLKKRSRSWSGSCTSFPSLRSPYSAPGFLLQPWYA